MKHSIQQIPVSGINIHLQTLERQIPNSVINITNVAKPQTFDIKGNELVKSSKLLT